MTTRVPIACTLASGDYSERLAWIAQLNRESLRSHHQNDVILDLVYDIAASSQIRELVRREEQCCAFLQFTVTESADAIHLRVEAPAHARDSTGALPDVLFAPFLARS